jgi:hypothetical protein
MWMAVTTTPPVTTSVTGRRPDRTWCPDWVYSPKWSWPWPGHPEAMKMEPSPRLFSHQCFMALAGPPRRDENKEKVVALVRRRLCLVPSKPLHTSVTQEPLRHPKLLP